MKTIELTGHVDKQHRLCIDVPAGVPPGPVKVILEVADDVDDPLSNAWARAIANVWAADWGDPREDIYTFEDGEPIDESR